MNMGIMEDVHQDLLFVITFELNYEELRRELRKVEEMCKTPLGRKKKRLLRGV